MTNVMSSFAGAVFVNAESADLTLSRIPAAEAASVSRIARIVAGGRMLFIAEMMGHLAVQSPLDERFG